MRVVRSFLIAIAVGGLIGSNAARAQDYLLAPGDTVEVSVIGMPDMRQRAQVDLDGNVSVPLVGPVRAAGTSLAALRARLQDLIGRKSLKRRFEDGRDVPTVIEPDELTVSIVEYRPVYVNGDVSKPGAVTYQPNITARQAVALAGGYDVMRFRINNPFIQAADLEGEYRTLAAEHAQQQAKVSRLRAELSGANAVQFDGTTPAEAALVRTLRGLEAEQFKTRAADLAGDRASLLTLIQFGDTELKSLTEQREKEAEGAKLDAADLERLSGLYERGNLPSNRLTDTRRVLLLSSTRLLQTNVQLERIRRDRELDTRKLQRLDNDRRLEVSRLLQEAEVKLASTAAKIQAVSEKLLYTSTVRSQLVRGTGGHPDLKVIRRNPDGTARTIPAAEDTALAPGDVVEVSLLADLTPAGGPPAYSADTPAGVPRPARP